MSRKASLQCTCTITVKRVYTVLYLAERENINVQKYKTYLKWQRKTIEDFNWNKKMCMVISQKNMGIACEDKTEEHKNMFFG